MPQKTEEEPIATGPDDAEMLVAENASLRDRLLRALADAENTRRQAERRVEDTRKFAVADFAREVLIVLDNLERTMRPPGAKPKTPWSTPR
jgi:molecular chaperone GrpE